MTFTEFNNSIANDEISLSSVYKKMTDLQLVDDEELLNSRSYSSTTTSVLMSSQMKEAIKFIAKANNASMNRYIVDKIRDIVINDYNDAVIKYKENSKNWKNKYKRKTIDNI